MKKSILTFAVLSLAGFAGAEVMDRPTGYKIGQRMTLKPYVSLSYTYDTNVDSSKREEAGSSWVVNPGFVFDYLGDNWSLRGGAYYQYHAYTRYSKSLNENSYGENLAFNWSNVENGGPGWKLTIAENYQKISQDDDMTNSGGRGLGRDRSQFTVSAVLERRFTENWHGNVNASYYYLDYDNDQSQYAPMYGWSRWTVGAEAGYTASKWTDYIISANYQGYTQDNEVDRGGSIGVPSSRQTDGESKGWTVQGGIASYATERISYRALIGWSAFKYGGGKADNSFTYTLSANWKMTDNWNMMLLANRYYQPSEREYSASILANAVSWGVGHSMIRGKLNATFDLSYRHEEHAYTAYSSNDYDEDILTARLGLNYIINRFFTVFGRVEYQTMFVNRGDTTSLNEYDYDRWRATIGLRLTY